jgi:hypothetical protein
MKTNLNEEIVRIKNLMSINEAVVPEVVSFLSKTLGYFDNVAKLTGDFSDLLKQTDRIKFNDFEYGIKDIVKRSLPNVDTTYLSPKFLVSQIAVYGDDVAKKELLYFLNKESGEIAQYTTNIIKNDETILKNVSNIEKSVLEGQLTNLGLDATRVNDITSSLYVDAKKMAEFAKSWKVNWAKTGGMRAEFADAIKQLDSNPTFNETYKRLINDEKYMNNVVERMYKDISSKTKEQAITFLETEFQKTLDTLIESGDSKGLQLYKQYWNWATALKTRMNKDASFIKKTYTAIATFYVGILLPIGLAWETIYWYLIRKEDETKKLFLRSKEGQQLVEQVKNNKITPAQLWEEYDNWGGFKDKTFWKGVGMKSVIVPEIIKNILGGGAEGMNIKLDGVEETIEQKTNEGQELLKLNDGTSTTTSTYVDNLPSFKKYMDEKTPPIPNSGSATEQKPEDTGISYKTYKGNGITYKFCKGNFITSDSECK